MSTKTDIQNLRAILGDRMVNTVQRTDKGPQFGYQIDSEFYTLDAAVDKFLPTPEEAREVLEVTVEYAPPGVLHPAAAQLAAELGTPLPEPQPVTVAEFEAQTAPQISTYPDALDALREKFTPATVAAQVIARHGAEARVIGEDNMSEIAREVHTRAANQRTGRALEMLDSNPQMPLF